MDTILEPEQDSEGLALAREIASGLGSGRARADRGRDRAARRQLPGALMARGDRPKKLVRVLGRGEGEATPAYVLGGVTLVVGVFVGLVVLAALLVWLFTK